MNGLEKAQVEVKKENPNLPMELGFEVSLSDTIQRLLAVKDLTLLTKDGEQRNIIGKVFDRIILKLKEHDFKNLQIIRNEPVVSVEDNFDNLLFSPGNPGRSSTYTRYVDNNHVLRTHTSAQIPGLLRSIGPNPQNATYVLPGLVYRRDVIDPRHLDVFHQIDIWTIQETTTYGKVTRTDLLKLVKAVFEAACPDAEMIIYEAIHPYTNEGIEVYAKVGDREIEVLECGLAHPEVLRRAGIDPEKYCGLALGMGLERLIMARKNLPDIRLIRSVDPRVTKQMADMGVYKPVSDKPAISRDMSYAVEKNYTEEDICESIRDVFGKNAELLEEVTILERTPFETLHAIAKEKLGVNEKQDNVLVRITLRHPDKTLTKEEALAMYRDAYPKLHKGRMSGYGV